VGRLRLKSRPGPRPESGPGLRSESGLRPESGPGLRSESGPDPGLRSVRGSDGRRGVGCPNVRPKKATSAPPPPASPPPPVSRPLPKMVGGGAELHWHVSHHRSYASHGMMQRNLPLIRSSPLPSLKAVEVCIAAVALKGGRWVSALMGVASLGCQMTSSFARLLALPQKLQTALQVWSLQCEQ
jgi:hypothetical protein